MEEDFVEQTRGRQIDLFVCSDAEAILGIGDQGVGVSGHESLWDLVEVIEIIILGHRCAQLLSKCRRW